MQTELREARRRKKWTLHVLANLSRVDASTISRLERGKQAPNHQTAQALELALRMKPGTLAFPKLSRAAKKSERDTSTVSAQVA